MCDPKGHSRLDVEEVDLAKAKTSIERLSISRILVVACYYALYSFVH